MQDGNWCRGDRVFMCAVHPESEVVAATATKSQQLAEAAAKETRPFEESVPSVYHPFRDVFSKESFDELPERRPWDHAIELKPGEVVNLVWLILWVVCCSVPCTLALLLWPVWHPISSSYLHHLSCALPHYTPFCVPFVPHLASPSTTFAHTLCILRVVYPDVRSTGVVASDKGAGTEA